MKLLEDPAVLKVAQNAKYDLGVLARYGIAVAPIDDTMLISYVLESGLHGHGMDELSELWLGHKPIAFKTVAGTGKAQKSFKHVALDQATCYAAEDADVTLRLYDILRTRLAREGLLTVYETLERPMPQVLAGMDGVWRGDVVPHREVEHADAVGGGDVVQRVARPHDRHFAISRRGHARGVRRGADHVAAATTGQQECDAGQTDQPTRRAHAAWALATR